MAIQRDNPRAQFLEYKREGTSIGDIDQSKANPLSGIHHKFFFDASVHGNDITKSTVMAGIPHIAIELNNLGVFVETPIVQHPRLRRDQQQERLLLVNNQYTAKPLANLLRTI